MAEKVSNLYMCQFCGENVAANSGDLDSHIGNCLKKTAYSIEDTNPSLQIIDAKNLIGMVSI